MVSEHDAFHRCLLSLRLEYEKVARVSKLGVLEIRSKAGPPKSGLLLASLSVTQNLVCSRFPFKTPLERTPPHTPGNSREHATAAAAGERSCRPADRSQTACSGMLCFLGFSQVAVGQNQWCHFGVGAPPILVYFSGDWDVHQGTGVLTHSQVTVL